MKCSRAASCSRERERTIRRELSSVEGAASSLSNSDRAFGGTLPRSVVRDDSSMGPEMRGAIAEVCALTVEQLSAMSPKAAATTIFERKRGRIMVFFLDL